MKRLHLPVMRVSLIVLCVLLFIPTTYSQSKKEQIKTLTFQADSLHQVIITERGMSEELEQEISKLRKEMVDVQKELTQAKTELLEKEKALSNNQKIFNERLINVLDSLQMVSTGLAKYKTLNNQEVTIGKQVWMTENLNVDKFRNGDPIPEVKTSEEWVKAGKNGEPAWCYYNNNPDNGDRYGKLYNWHAVNDPRGLAPEGWKIPSDEDWTILTDYLGGELVAGRKMKSTSGWPDLSAVVPVFGSNESGFSGLPGGYRSYNGLFHYVGYNGYWWSSTEHDTNSAWSRNLGYTNGYVGRGKGGKATGLSVRCLRD